MKKIIILLFITTVLASGCKKYLDVNNNPNQPTVVTPNVVLSAGLTGSAAAVGINYNSVNRYMGFWSRSGNYVADAVNEQYQFNNSMTDADFASEYTVLNRYHYIETAGTVNGLPFYVGVAKTMEALHFSRLVDIYGNVPYSQAFNPTKYEKPKYDDAATIYGELITKLDSAVTVFQAAITYYKSAPKTQINTDDQYDLIFGRGAGVAPTLRMTEWIQFANTIKLMLLLHEAAPGVITDAYRTAEIAKITANGAGYLPAGLSAAVNPGYSNTSNKQNPFYAFFETPTAANVALGEFRANQYAIAFYNMGSDERGNFFYGAPYTNGLPQGNYDGDPNSLTNTVISQIGGDGDQAAYHATLANAGTLKSSAQDQLIISDFESLFIQAEAAQRGWITGSAATFYKEAVEQSFRYLNAGLYGTGDPKDDADDYLAGNGNLTSPTNTDYVVFAGAKDPLGVIMTQKWASLNSINPISVWTDYRRTGYPVASILSISHSTTHVKNAIPTRYLYPQSELNTNSANVPVIAAPAQYGLIFWDKN